MPASVTVAMHPASMSFATAVLPTTTFCTFLAQLRQARVVQRLGVHRVVGAFVPENSRELLATGATDKTGVAALLVRLIPNQQVEGSIPSWRASPSRAPGASYAARGDCRAPQGPKHFAECSTPERELAATHLYTRGRDAACNETPSALARLSL
jgi:hypothetical protein